MLTELPKKLLTILKIARRFEAYPLGSLRRQVATIGDIDIAVKTESQKKSFTILPTTPKLKKFWRGERKPYAELS